MPSGDILLTSSPSFNEQAASTLSHDLPSQGTVGAVCLDSWGNLAVATSTGGLTNKRPGRIGDTPTVGAGFWAESWNETVQINLLDHRHQQKRSEEAQHTTFSSPSPIQKILNLTGGQESLSYLTSCLPPSISSLLSPFPLPSTNKSYLPIPQTSQPTSQPPQPHPPLNPTHPRRHAIALSGTGNGDSFLRLCATHTAASISRFSHLPLSTALTLVAGPNGLLQQSADDRWGIHGEGEGGIIGIEVVLYPERSEASDGAGGGCSSATGDLEAKVVSDFNCGGMWRAYHIDDGRGRQEAKVMVFRDEY